MFGGGPLGGFPLGSLISIVKLIFSLINAEARGKEEKEEDINAQTIGTAYLKIAKNYRILVKDEFDNFIGEFHNFRKLKFSKRLNNYGMASFEIPANDEKVKDLISLRLYSIEIYEQVDSNSYLIWAGEQAMREGNLTNNNDNWITIHCYTWFEQLKDRYTDAERLFTDTDQGEIAWTLIDETQSDGYYGNLGITRGEIETTFKRDRSYYNDNIMEAIINLSDVLSGFDFEITDEKVFNVKNAIGEDKSDDIIFEYGVNVSSVKVIEDFVKPVNRAIILGEAVDNNELVRSERDNEDSQALYGLREAVESYMTVSETKTMEEKGDAMLRKYKEPLLQVDMTLVPSADFLINDINIGDGIRLIINSGIYDINEQYRIFEWEAEYDTVNAIKLSLVLGNFTYES